MKQGRADIKGTYDGKVEPNSEFVNPGAVSYLGNKLGNHTTDDGDFPLKIDPWGAGRGYTPPGPTPAPPGVGGGRTIHSSGSQGKHK
jgi:hypothetical protein